MSNKFGKIPGFKIDFINFMVHKIYYKSYGWSRGDFEYSIKIIYITIFQLN